MSLYLTRFSYLPETWARLTKNPEDRSVAAKSYHCRLSPAWCVTPVPKRGPGPSGCAQMVAARNPDRRSGVPAPLSAPLRVAAVLLLSIGLASCGSTAPTPTPPFEPVDASGDWILESGTLDGAGIPVLADYPITFSVDGTEVGGQAACNDYGGRLTLVDGQIRLGQTSSTAMLCGDPDGEVMRSEAAFGRALGEVRAARLEGDRLTLTGPAVELVFNRQAPIPLAELVGTDWVLESVIDGDVASAAIGDPATLRLDKDGSFHGSTGCRTFTGTWIEAAGRLAATQLAMEGECPDGLAGQDGAVAEAIDGALVSIEGDGLTLTKNGGSSLVYRRGP